MRMLSLFFCFLSLGLACGKFKRDNEPDRELKIEQFAELKKTYCDLGKANGESVQWNIHQCDSLLHASLFDVACGNVPIEKFMDDSGQWFRTTTHDCFVDGKENGSDSTISKDMFRGLFHALLSDKRKNLVDKTIEYGKANNWVMGQAIDDKVLAGKCVMTPNLINELYDLQGKLELNRLEGSSSDSIGQNTGFRAHLDVLAVLFHGRLYGAISDIELETLKWQADRQPDNSLFNFAYRLYNKEHSISQALAILDNAQYFPKDRLPTSSDRCVGNLFEHDKKDSDWSPCPKEKLTHSGTDLVFAISVLDGTF